MLLQHKIHAEWLYLNQQQKSLIRALQLPKPSPNNPVQLKYSTLLQQINQPNGIQQLIIFLETAKTNLNSHIPGISTKLKTAQQLKAIQKNIKDLEKELNMAPF